MLNKLKEHKKLIAAVLAAALIIVAATTTKIDDRVVNVVVKVFEVLADEHVARPAE